MIPTDVPDELMGMELGQIVTDMGCVLATAVVRVPAPEGGFREGKRTGAIAIYYTVLKEWVQTMPAFLAEMRTQGADSDILPPPSTGPIRWLEGPTLGDPGGPIYLCNGLGVAAQADVARGAAVLVMEVIQRGDPQQTTSTGYYAMSYRNLVAMTEAMGKVMRKMEKKSATRARGLH